MKPSNVVLTIESNGVSVLKTCINLLNDNNNVGFAKHHIVWMKQWCCLQPAMLITVLGSETAVL